MKKIIHTDLAPKAVGVYSQAVAVGDLLFVSGQLPIDPKTSEFKEGGIFEKTTQSLLNIKNILEENGMTLDNVVKTTVLLVDINDFQEMNRAYSNFFEKDFPARSAFAVKELPKGSIVEIEVIAHK